MSRRRSIKFLSVLAAASLVVAACGDDDDDDAVIGRNHRRDVGRHGSAGRDDRRHRGRGHRARRTRRPKAPSPRAPSRKGRRRQVQASRSAAAPAAARTARTRRTAEAASRRGPRGLEPGAVLVQQQHQPRQRHRQRQPALPDDGRRRRLRASRTTTRPQLRQQRPVRHVHARLARPADDHVHDQRGRHVVRRHAGRRRRPASSSGRRRAACSTTPTRSSPTPASRPRPTRAARPSSSGPTAPTSRRPTRRYAAAFDEDGALLEGYTYKASTGVSFDTASESLQLVTQFPEISEDGQSRDGDVGHVLRRLPDGGHVPRASRRTSSARTRSASRIRWRPRRR